MNTLKSEISVFLKLHYCIRKFEGKSQTDKTVFKYILCAEKVCYVFLAKRK